MTLFSLPCPLGIQQQLLCLADIVLRLLQDGIHVGKAANPFLDFIGEMSDLEGRSRDGELQHTVGHCLDAVWVCAFLWEREMGQVAALTT